MRRALVLFVAIVAGCGNHGSVGAPDLATIDAAAPASRVLDLRSRFSRQGHPTLEPGSTARFDEAGAWVRPVAAGGAALRPAAVLLPRRADGEVEVKDETGGLSVRFALEQASQAPLEVEEGLALYRDALPGADLVHRPHAGGTEDYVAFERRPSRAELAYQVDVSRVAGLRLVSNVVEMLDGKGTPRLRIAPPYVIDRDKKRHPATLSIEGCAFDADPRAPWDRPVTAPGAARCRVVVRWPEIGYPALVDPAWVTTGSMITARSRHAMAVLPGGKVLVAGGWSAAGPMLSTAEVFDGMGAFAATASMTTTRQLLSATSLASGKVLVLGGADDSGTYLSSAEVFDGAAFTAVGSSSVPRVGHTATLTSTGKVLVAGSAAGFSASADLFDGVSAFTALAPLAHVRGYHAATALAGGKVLLTGGYDGSSSVGEAELFDGSSFKSGGTLNNPRVNHVAVQLASGKVLVAAGAVGGSANSSMEVWDGTSFVTVGSLLKPRIEAFGTLLPNNRVLLVGGWALGVFGVGDSAELVSEAGWTTMYTGAPVQMRRESAAVALPSGKVLVSGGEVFSAKTSSAELYDLGAAGATCFGNDDCASGTCFGGVCCAGACSGTCKTCAAGTGACVTVTNARDSGSCIGSYLCDAVGECKLDLAQTAATGTLCASGFASDGVCCNEACSGTCTVCSKLTGLCQSRTNADDPDTCTGASTCSASGACRLKTGQPSTVGASCTSGFASDGVCCDQACAGGCDTCNQTGKVGTCSPLPVGNPGVSCAPFLCQGGASCPTTCASDTQCAGGHFCNGSCTPKRANGASCSSGAHECTSGFCIDGVCCDGACGGNCQACDLTAGTCTNVTGAPRGGRGSCGAYTCQGTSTSCPSACADDAGCSSGFFCSAGACVAKKASGGACPTGAHECANGICADGYCCNSACGQQCEACDVGGAEGTCTAVSGKPHGSKAACTGTGICAATCNGSTRSACGAPPGSSQVCAAASCTAGTAKSAAYCDGLGACSAPTTSGCGAYVCNGVSCGSSCTTNGDCSSGYACKAGACVTLGDPGTSCTDDLQCASKHCVASSISTKVCCSDAACPAGSLCADVTAGPDAGKCKKVNAQVCGSDAECLSGRCADGVCCNTGCNGQCEACDLAGSVGTCTPVKGAPHAGRAACPTDASNVCASASCDGASRNSCAALPGTDVVCQAARCASGTASSAATCDGKGKCGTSAATACGAYTCDAAGMACRTSCEKSSDCASGYACQGSTCTPVSNKCSDDGTAIIGSDGRSTPCSPTRCKGGACVEVCTVTDDCATGYLCGADGKCTPPPPSSGEEGGCRYGHTRAGAPAVSLLALLSLAWLRRRRSTS